MTGKRKEDDKGGIIGSRREEDKGMDDKLEKGRG